MSILESEDVLFPHDMDLDAFVCRNLLCSGQVFGATGYFNFLLVKIYLVPKFPSAAPLKILQIMLNALVFPTVE